MDVLCVGHAAFDIAMTVPEHPGPNDKVQASSMVLGGGGPAANAAVQVARLGGRAGFAGYLGCDPLGEAHVEELRSEGVALDWLLRGKAPTPVSQILAKPDGTRSVVNYKGGTPALPANAVATESIRARVLLFDGHEPRVSEHLCAWAHRRRIPTVLDAGSLHAGTKALAMKVDFLLASETFARQYTGCSDPAQALRRIARDRSHVVITLGERGLIAWGRGHFSFIPAFAVQVVDSTGAGDAFHGAFALALAEGREWEAALRFAAAAGALACTRLGARAALPDRSAVEGLLAG